MIVPALRRYVVRGLTSVALALVAVAAWRGYRDPEFALQLISASWLCR